mgnify:CR=1 FL=1
MHNTETVGKMNMTEVAKAAGVSQSTVSRVVNGRSFVGEKTRHRVHEAMERLGYTPQPPDRRPGRDPVPEVRPRSGLLAVLVNRDATIIHSAAASPPFFTSSAVISLSPSYLIVWMPS